MVAIFFNELTALVEHCLTNRANLCVASSKLTFVSEAVQLDLEDVCIELLNVAIGAHVCDSAFLCLELAAHHALIGTFLLVTEVQVTAKIVGVKLFA